MANNFFLEDDEELKKSKKDDEEFDDDYDEKDKEDGNDYLGDFDSDDEGDDSYSDDGDTEGNDYIGDEEDSSSSEDDDDSSSDDDYGTNDYIGDNDTASSSESDSQGSGLLAKLAYAIVVACNNFEHVHLMCAGKKFDTIHSMTDNLVGKIWYITDTAAELALENEECELDNFCNAAKYVPEMSVETEKTYDYETACTAVSETLRKLIEIAQEARDASSKSHVQSKVDEWLAMLNKEYNFLMKRRMKNVDESAVVANDYI